MTWAEARRRHARGAWLSPDAVDMLGLAPWGNRSQACTTRASVTRTGRATTRRRTAAFRSAGKASSSSGDDGGGEPPPPRPAALAPGQVAAAGFVPEGVES
jgi:hypothetical protein